MLVEKGHATRFVLALDEWYLPARPANSRLQKRVPAIHAQDLLQQAAQEAARSGRWPGLVLYPEKGPRDAYTRRVLTGEVSIPLGQNPPEARAEAERMNLRLAGAPLHTPYLSHTVGHADTPLAALAATKELRSRGIAAEPLLMRRRMSKNALVNDEFFGLQWYLKNTGSKGSLAGIDAGIESVWNFAQGRGLGQGIQVAVVDNGLELNHPDLVENIATAGLHYDWIDGDASPSPGSDFDSHGTLVGGILGARGNNQIGTSGVAPRVSLVGFRLLGDLSTVQMEAESVLRSNDNIQIKNNSWGPPDGYPWELGAAGSQVTLAMEYAATLGRGGLGTVSVWAAGNGRLLGDQGNKDGYANSIYGIAVGAVTSRGLLSPYSETGSHLTVVAPGGDSKLGITTTDLAGVAGENSGSLKDLYEVDYTQIFTGTSAATPVVSGVIALMLEENPGLNWRDVKEILLRSSVKLSPKDKGWVERNGGDATVPPLPPIKHHESYGGGLVHAGKAVEMARDWISLGPLVAESLTGSPPVVSQASQPRGTTIIIPVPEESKPKTKVTRINLDFSEKAALRVEHVTIKVSASHQRRGDLTIKLVSPAGTVSTLASYSKKDVGENYSGWVFSSVRHWGESSRGTWSVVASEPDDDVNGSLSDVTVTLHGSSYPAAHFTVTPPARQLLPEGAAFALVTDYATHGPTTAQWFKNDKALPGQEQKTLTFAALALADAGRYEFRVTNLTGSPTAQTELGIVRMLNPALKVLPGRTATLAVAAAGPDLRYQWFAGSMPLQDDDRITGSRQARLMIRRTGVEDAGDYFCRVSMGDEPPISSRVSLTLLTPPDLSAFEAPGDAIVSGSVDLLIPAENDPVRFTASGLPPGVRLDAKTGRLTGKPVRAGTYAVTLRASNAAGSSEPVSFTWQVDALPDGTVGTYQGLLDRSAIFNGGHGGLVTLTLGKTGTFTGVLVRGSQRTPLRGVLDAYPGETFTTGTLMLARKGQPPLEFTFGLLDGRMDGSLGTEEEDYISFTAWRLWTQLPEMLAGQEGRYNVPLISEETDAAFPLGSGFVSLTLNTAGSIRYSGRLADGTAITGSRTGTQENRLALHHMLYGKAGSLQGEMQWTQEGENSSPAIQVQANWLKLSTTGRLYKAGFSLARLRGTGGRYVAPEKSGIVFGLQAAPLNARAEFSQGGLFIPFIQSFTLGAGSVAILPGSSGNPHQISFKVAPATGLITGKGQALDIDPDNPALNRQRPGTCNALIIPGLERAEGYFLLPEDRGPAASILSGRLIIRPAQSP